MPNPPVFQPKGTRDGSRFVAGQTVYVVRRLFTQQTWHIASTRRRAKRWIEKYWAGDPADAEVVSWVVDQGEL